MKKAAMILICLCLAAFFSGCAPKMEETRFFAMDTIMTVTVYGRTREEAKAATVSCEREIYRLDGLLSAFAEGSEIAEINGAQGRATAVGGEVSGLIRTAIGVSERTNGAFDITVLPLMRAWGFAEGAGKIPNEEELREALVLAGFGEISLENGGIRLPVGMAIDLGGIAKGYASQRLMEVLKEKGVSSAIVSLGGNVQALGRRPDGGLWRVAVQDPLDGGGYAAIIEVEDMAVVTSGGYQRFFEEGGKTYHHIIDPSNGYPAESGLLSVTVICPDGTLADAYSTAFFVMGMEKSIEILKGMDGFDAVFITENGEIFYTEGLSGRVSQGNGGYALHMDGGR